MKIQTPTVHAFAKVVMESAIRIKNAQVLETLRRCGVKLDSMLYEIASIGDVNLTRRVLSDADPACLGRTVLGAKLFHHFVFYQQYDFAQSLLAIGVSVDARFDQQHGVYSETALYSMVRRNDIEGARFLLKAGASVNLYYYPIHGACFFSSQHTVLGYAVYLRHAELVLLLLEYEADMFLKFEGKPLLEWAALRRRSIFELLKKKTEPGSIGFLLADVVDAANRGSHALATYIAGQPEIVTPHQLEQALEESIIGNHFMGAITLLQHGVNPNGPTLNARPLATALHGDHIDNGFVELLLEHDADVGHAGLLEKLVETGRQDLLERFLTRHIDLEQRMDALVAACSGVDGVSGGIGSVATIIRSGVDIDTPGLPRNPLQTAAWYQNESMLLFLIKQGANVNAPAYSNGGRTALQAALRTGKPVKLAKMLLRHGADASAPPAMLDGFTALEAFCNNAFAAGSPEFCDTLIAAGATVNRPCGRPGSVLHGVIERGWHEVLRRFLEPPHNGINNHMWYLESDSLSPFTPTQLAASLGDLEAVKILLDHGANVNEAPGDRFGRTALQAASLLPPGPAKMTLIHHLLDDRGADINADAAIQCGITALQGAAIAGDFKLAELLIKRGADVNAWPSFEDGRTAIEAAAEHGRLDMVQLLLNAEAVGDVTRGEGFKFAIELAEKNGHFAVASLLKGQDGTV
ncbi:hypothetical protein NEMBOFW57_002616 [Staphylotrichum longicolle]|uniref:Ankyrin n=1 Tax=Staphylotrichum longicolle TaxID=669026 RepID=A0AAD4F3U5_9PEZI|nr:hypothetical protein NEMBOFW57_002616 [Staphylotrichum longicolle]